MDKRYTLKGRMPGLSNRPPARLQSIARHSKKPIWEGCPTDTKEPDMPGKTNLNAHELFNLFTADIIKTNVIFIR
jgi:hypothetical protein